MRVGILADTHDRVPAIAELVNRLVAGGASLLMHAGDHCSPFSLAPVNDSNIPMLGVFGRNDGDPEGLNAMAAHGVGTELYESPHSFEVAGKQILIVHDIGDVHQRSLDKHQFVFHGSSHKVEMTTRGDTLVLNPGEGCGWLYGSCTAALVDLDTREVEIIKL
ncbi:MAG TPA: metallophosphoesterase family protein [Candidatus Elarobacter sp.]|nr:metallophosphoesterase family protein [Candidatus Elarobacter sp.]